MSEPIDRQPGLPTAGADDTREAGRLKVSFRLRVWPLDPDTNEPALGYLEFDLWASNADAASAIARHFFLPFDVARLEVVPVGHRG